jgi:hypothetical protein
MPFDTRVVPMVGLRAALVRVAATTTAARPAAPEGGCRGERERGGPPGRTDRGRVSRMLIGRDER